MAKTPFRANVQNGSPYTVPAGKIAIFKAFHLADAAGGASPAISIAAVPVAALRGDIDATRPRMMEAGPLTAGAGEVVSCTGSVGLSGFLYDA